MSKIHYAPYGEWGGQRVNCNRFYSANVAHTGVKEKVTCKYCKQTLNNKGNGNKL